MSLTTWFYYLPPCFTFTPPSFEVSLSFYVLLPNFAMEIMSSCFYILPLVFKSCHLMLLLPPIFTSLHLHLPFTNTFLAFLRQMWLIWRFWCFSRLLAALPALNSCGLILVLVPTFISQCLFWCLTVCFQDLPPVFKSWDFFLILTIYFSVLPLIFSSYCLFVMSLQLQSIGSGPNWY